MCKAASSGHVSQIPKSQVSAHLQGVLKYMTAASRMAPDVGIDVSATQHCLVPISFQEPKARSIESTRSMFLFLVRVRLNVAMVTRHPYFISLVVSADCFGPGCLLGCDDLQFMQQVRHQATWTTICTFFILMVHLCLFLDYFSNNCIYGSLKYWNHSCLGHTAVPLMAGCCCCYTTYFACTTASIAVLLTVNVTCLQSVLLCERPSRWLCADPRGVLWQVQGGG